MSRLTLSVSLSATAMTPSLLVRYQRQCGAGTPVAPVVDPADAGHQRIGGIFDLALAGFAHQLTHRLNEIMRGAGGLAGRDLAAAGVHWQRALVGQVSITDERHALPGLAEPECLELHHDRDQKIIVRMERTDVLDVQPGGAQRLLAGNLMTAAGDVDKIVTAQKIRTLRIADRDNIFVQTFLARALSAGDDQAGGSVGQHDAVKEPDRISDQA